jgi:hypothetical protein
MIFNISSNPLAAAALHRWCSWLAGIVVCCALQACQSNPSVNTAQAKPPEPSLKQAPVENFFVPKAAFAPSAAAVSSNAKLLTKDAPYEAWASLASPSAYGRQVLIYSSSANRALFVSGGFDALQAERVWEEFLKKYQINYKLAAGVSQIEQLNSGLLILPSLVALSFRERQAVIDFRARGGSVLSTWLTGVRDEKGAWLGFDFMRKAFDTKVVGDTSADKDDNFLMPNGDNPVTNHLQAGHRVWLERARGWYPLRLSGRHAGAHIMDWSRTFTPEKSTAVITYNERPISAMYSSRNVVLGYPERLWQSANPEHLEAIAYNAVTWLLRLPSAYKAAWPAPYSSAMMLAVDAAEVVADADMKVASLFEEIGAKATIYTLSDNLPKSAKYFKELQNRGHELAFMGDTFMGFKNQSLVAQKARFEKMRQTMSTAGIALGPNPGFHAPTESYDKNTEFLLEQDGFGHFIATMEATESRLPFMLPSSVSKPATVVLPRTQRGPEDATEEGDVDDGLKSFLAELKLAKSMGGLSVLRMPTQSLLPLEDWQKVADGIKELSQNMWMATASQIAQFWRERERVRVQIEGDAHKPFLAVQIAGTTLLTEAVVVWVNLQKKSQGVVGVFNIDGSAAPVSLISVDPWRIGVVLNQLAPRNYKWQLKLTDD